MLVFTNISVKVFARSLHIVGGGRAGSNKDGKYEYLSNDANHYSQRRTSR